MIRLINANKAIAELELDVEMDKAALDNLDIVGKTRDEIEFDMKWKQKAIELLQTEPTVLQAYDNGLIPCIRK